MVGDAGAPHTIEHKGVTYTIRRVVTEEVMDDVEMKLYGRAKTALYEQREIMPLDMYERKLDDLRDRFTAGEFSFESDSTTAFLKTKAGVMLLLECMMSASSADILVLLAERNEDMRGLLKDVLALSFPKGLDLPKGQQPRRAKRRR